MKKMDCKTSDISAGAVLTADEFSVKARAVPTATGEEKVVLLQQLSSCFNKENTHPNLVVVTKTEFIGHLADTMTENKQWAREEPKWIQDVIDSIYYCMQWEIPLDQTKRLLEVTKLYLILHESAFSITLLHRILTPIRNKHMVLADLEIYYYLKKIIAAAGKLKYNAVRCLQAAVLHSAEWQKTVLTDTPFVMELVNAPTHETWALLSIVAQHFDAKLLFPSEVLAKAKLSTDIDHCINLCAILCSEADATELQLVLAYVALRARRLEELLAIQHEKGKVFPNSLLSLVLPFVNLSIPDKNKEPLGEKLVSPLLRVLKIQRKEGLPLISKIENCLERAQQEASRALWNLAFNPQNIDRIETEGGMDLLKSLIDSGDSRVKRNVTGILYMYSQRERRGTITAEQKKPISLTNSTRHVMISYNWANQPTIKRLAESLKQHGYKIWVDYEQMEGSTLEAMAQAVEGSSLILMCFSEKYKDSPNCRLEGEYCMKRGINFIPLRLQKGYKPDGWLGIAMGNKLYHDFTTEDEWAPKMDKLLKEMGHSEASHNQHGAHSSPAHTPRAPDVNDFSIRSQQTEEPQPKRIWSNTELLNWMKLEGIEAHYEAFISHKVTVRALLELRSILRSDNSSAITLIREVLGLTHLGDILELAAAVKNLNV